MLMKIKGILGFCQCKKCWNRAIATITIKQIDKDIDVCEKHLAQVTEGATLTGIDFN